LGIVPYIFKQTEMSRKLILDEQSIVDEEEQAYKRFGNEEHEKVRAYIEGLKDGAMWYHLDKN